MLSQKDKENIFAWRAPIAARGESRSDGCPAVPNESLANKNFVMRCKDCMANEDFDEILI